MFRIATGPGRLTSSAIRDLLTVADAPGVVSLAGGLPAAETLPAGEISAAMTKLLAEDADHALQYSTTQGYPPLRELIGEAHAERVIVTHGSQQALDLIARALIDPGDVVAITDPGYVGALQAFGLAGADLRGIPSDVGGMDVDALARRLVSGIRPVLVYVVANFDNPTGATLTGERRATLAELADRYGFVIVDDDPYGHLRWAGERVAPISSFGERVITLGTVSKVLSPGLRVGYAIGPDELIRTMVRIKQAADLHTSTLSQRVAFELLGSSPFIENHLAKLPGIYRRRAETLATSLRSHLPDAEFAAPQGGMFLWVTLPHEGPYAGINTESLLPHALARGVAFVPGAAFGVQSQHPKALRLSYATASLSDLEESGRRLRLAVEDLAADLRHAC